MSTWQIVITIVGAVYAGMVMVFVLVSVRDWRQGDVDETVREFCPPGVNCQLCRRAEERRGLRAGAGH